MKKINDYSAFFTYLLLGCCASTDGGKVTTDQLNFQRVYEIKNIPSEEIFDRTVEWMAVTFVDSREVVELKDRERGKIIGNGMEEFKDVVNIRECKFMITIEIKDNRFRITFSNYFWLETACVYIPLDKKYRVDQVNTSFLNMSDNLFNFIINYSDDTW